MATMENLKDAFASRARRTASIWRLPEKRMRMAIRRWRSYSGRRLWAEAVHAIVDLRAIGEVESTAENLQEASQR